MQKINPFLWFDNNAGEAIDFYLSVFKNSKKLRVANNPPGAPGPEGALLVAAIELEGQEIILMNGGPGHPLTDAFSLTINCETQAEVDYYWSHDENDQAGYRKTAGSGGCKELRSPGTKTLPH